ncbi:hypothetical protein CQ046_03430 [Chryseobacterium sp. MYb7]|nr:hypothetical protein CQ046_03430 [Chryseobacterium sp. MYb7]
MQKTLNKECKIFIKSHVLHYNKYYFKTNHIKQPFKPPRQKFFEFPPPLQRMGMVKHLLDDSRTVRFLF